MRRLLAFLLLLSACRSEPLRRDPPLPAPDAAGLSAEERGLVSWLDGRQEEMTELLRRAVDINSGTRNLEGLARVRELFRSKLEGLGFSTRRVPGGAAVFPSCAGPTELKFADHLLATRAGRRGPRLLLNGHLDTVFPRGHPFSKLEVHDGIGRGPGASDMKGGLVVLLYALKALDAAGRLDGARLSVLLNTDEEMGSLGSRPRIEAEARRHDLGLVFESGHRNSLVRRRKGLGQARLVVRGRAAHAGAAHREGLSAVRELARKIIEIEKLTDYRNGVTLNVGTIAGGEARNTVPPCAEAALDIRYPEARLGAKTAARLRSIAEHAYTRNRKLGLRPSSRMRLVLHRPPKVPTADSDRLLQEARRAAADLGQKTRVRDSGGGTDGSLMQAVGLPTLDSLGVDGNGAHSPREKVELASLVERAKLAALLIDRLVARPDGAE